MLSPYLFSILLEAVFDTSEKFKRLINTGDLIAFADDILVMASSLAEAEQ